MTFDPDVITRSTRSVPSPHESMQIPAGKMVSLRFLRQALRRRRRLWIGLAVIGLLAGVGYHVAVPVKYSATATLYLAQPPGTNNTVGAANDLAMLSTAGVADAAIKQLGEPELTMGALFGKAPGKTVSPDVMNITISGSSSGEAIRRANAVAAAYLAYRSEQYDAQNQAVVAAAQKQIDKLQATIAKLTTKIESLGGTNATAAASLTSQRAAATTQISNLRASIQQDAISTLSVSKGSRIITAATPAHTSKAKVMLLDGLTGLVIGLALGLAIVVLQAILSDRLRRREDVAAVLGVPVDVSVGRPRRGRVVRRIGRISWVSRLSGNRLAVRSVRSLTKHPDDGLLRFAVYLDERLKSGGTKPTEMVVAVDDIEVPAAALLLVADQLAREGRQVVLVDLTGSRAVGAAVGAGDAGSERVSLGAGAEIILVTPRQPWEAEESGQWGYDLADLVDADAILALATVSPAVGAWHLRTWATDAVLTVSAGRSTVQEISAVSELLDAAAIHVSSAVLLNADATDQSVGLPEAGVASDGRHHRITLANGAVPVAT